ncbi:hypothetical protein AUP68_03855 [Ilyonectria robusta]
MRASSCEEKGRFPPFHLKAFTALHPQSRASAMELDHQMSRDKAHRLPEQNPTVRGTANKSFSIPSRELSRIDSTGSTLADDKPQRLKHIDSGLTANSMLDDSLYARPATLDLSLHPGLGLFGLDVLNNEANFLPDSRLDVLTVSGPENRLAFHTDQSDAQVEATIDFLESSTGSPALIVICVKLEADPNASFEQKAWMSKSLAKKLFSYYDIHAGFLLDLVGRPNYWSALSQVKTDPRHHQDVFELFCQHPRWHQKGRYDKEKGAMQGNKAPCSLYMAYSVATDTTVYLVVAPDDGIWFSFVDLIQLSPPKDGHTLVSGRELATSPFLVHSMVSNIAFEQATIYAADTRIRLMTQLKKVNDYSDSQDLENMQTEDMHDFDSRKELSSITRQLYSVSQMINTGLGSASSAVKLSVKLLEAHTQFCQRTGRGGPGTSVSRTHTALQYVHDAYLYQQSWLEQYKTRKETAMGFVSLLTPYIRGPRLTMGIGVQHGHARGQLPCSQHILSNVPGQFFSTCNHSPHHDLPSGDLYGVLPSELATLAQLRSQLG